MLTYHDLKNDAIGELRNRLEMECGTDGCDVSDIIHEVTENRIPVYTRELLEVAFSNFYLVSSIPDLGPAYGEPSPINFIISNVYEYLSSDLQSRYSQNKNK